MFLVSTHVWRPLADLGFILRLFETFEALYLVVSFLGQWCADRVCFYFLFLEWLPGWLGLFSNIYLGVLCVILLLCSQRLSLWDSDACAAVATSTMQLNSKF